MADSSAVRRSLFMHPAHRMVGILGDGTALRPYCRIERFSTDGVEPAPMRLSLVAGKLDTDALAALALFEQAIHAERGDIQCRRADLDAGLQGLAETDGVVVFGRWLHVARYWSDLDAAELGRADIPVCPVGRHLSGSQEYLPHLGEDQPMAVEIAAATGGHPVLEGVGPFESRSCPDAGKGVCIPKDATLLLTGRTVAAVRPVAWVWRGRGRVFCTTLGSSDDFRQPDFVRLVLNALAWIGR